MPTNPWIAVAEGFRAEHVAMSTWSRDEAIERLSLKLSPHQIRLIGASDAFAARFASANSLAGLQISALAFGTEVELAIATSVDHLLVTAQVAGNSVIASQGIRAQGGTGFIVIDSTPDVVIKQFSADSRRINLRVPRARLNAVWNSLTGQAVKCPFVFHPFIDDSHVRQHWGSHLRLLMDYGLAPREVPAHQAEVITESVLLAMLLEFPHNHSRMLDASLEHAGTRAFNTAQAFIDASLREPLCLQTIARECGVSIRTLTALFRRECGLSPMVYVQEQRLQAARLALTRRRPGLTVASIATEYGFSGLGRFAATYRARFGELPSETLNRR